MAVRLGELFRQAVEVVVVVTDFLQRAGAVDAGKGFVTFVFVEVEAGLLMAITLPFALRTSNRSGAAEGDLKYRPLVYFLLFITGSARFSSPSFIRCKSFTAREKP